MSEAMTDAAPILPPPAIPANQPGACHSGELLLHLARLVYGGTADASLTPAQWTALRYFANANRFSRTPSAFSEFHATTRGTASQTVKSLIALGLLEKRAHESDGRSFLIELTPEGRARLAQDPLDDLSHCLHALPPARRAAFRETLTELIAAMALRRSAPTFGKCGDCGHCDTSRPDTVFCRCTRSTLDGTEMNTLCVDFAPGSLRR